MKYYVQSGSYKSVIAGPHIESPEDAATESLINSAFTGKTQRLSYSVIVSVRGFDFHSHELEEDYTFKTEDILKKAGLL